MLNKSFLGNWCLRFVVERDRSWRQVISAKFGEKMGGWCSHEGREWFWLELWYGDSFLRAMFHALYSIPNSKDACQNVMTSDLLPFWGAMGDALLCEKEPLGMAWNLLGYLLLSSQEGEDAHSASSCLLCQWHEQPEILFPNMQIPVHEWTRSNTTAAEGLISVQNQDFLCAEEFLAQACSLSDTESCIFLCHGLFTVKSFFLALSQFSGSSPVFPTKFVWNSQVPFKVKSFVCQDGLGPPRSIFDMMSINYKGCGLSKRGIVLWQAVYIALIWVILLHVFFSPSPPIIKSLGGPGVICMELARQQCDSQYLSHAIKSLMKAQEISLIPLPFVPTLLAQAEASRGSKAKWEKNLCLEWFSWPPGMVFT
ncbi:Tetratricopeptide repeat protein SKI3 [Vitis vinifera]|uniref:Tetratricopeptide repeat protein SKI3 n=1 Tax=Vitis vinifera TaxID=29760 RepID=A0A438EU65_VITVI|nr:Tetratricopeptide repeat protein SKI3 [Vitis vinifera]